MKAPLSVTHSALAEEWHPDKNGKISPDDVTAGSGKRAWWRCHVDPAHEWQATVGNRAKLGSGCRFCSGQAATWATSLGTVRPGVAAEWHPEKNGNLTPADVKTGSGKRVWWRCGVDPSHEWEAVVGARASGHGCPYCSGRRPTDANSLAALRPDLGVVKQ